jgi:SagB-type dehydrogenase family enzyme
MRVTLPPPRGDGKVSVERALRRRRSRRDFTDQPLTLAEVAQLLWAAQGITGAEGERSAPSAGGLYPLESYLVAGKVDDLTTGVYRYDPRRHLLTRILEGDRRVPLARIAVDQSCVRDAAADLVFAAVYSRTTRKYGERGERYVHIDLGHAAQNVYLQAEALGLGTVIVGAFDDEPVARLLSLGRGQKPLAIMPVGRKTTTHSGR